MSSEHGQQQQQEQGVLPQQEQQEWWAPDHWKKYLGEYCTAATTAAAMG
jgi:hypothetical protein